MTVRSLRARIILLFCGVVGILLLVCFSGLYLLVSRSIRAAFDTRLTESAAPLAADLEADASAEDIGQLKLPNEYFELLDPAGNVLALSRNLGQQPLAGIGAPGAAERSALRETRDGRLGPLRVALIPVQLGPAPRILVAAIPTTGRDRALADFRRLLLALFLSSLAVMALVAAWFAGRSLRPVTELTGRVSRVIEQLPGQPTASGAGPPPIAGSEAADELGQLAGAFNELFQRMEGAFAQLRQFVSDASHELRTPLSVLRGETELLLAEPRRPEEYQQALAVMDAELKRLERIAEGLFTLAMADAGQLQLAREPLYLNEVLEEACARATPRAREKDIRIERALEEVAYAGDEAFLRQLFLIFLDNAVKYSRPGTRVRVRLAQSNGTAKIEFRDEGFGIAPEHLPHIFKRFYRARPAADTETQSGGLGLAIAQAIVEAEGGSIECASRAGAGSTFTIRLPIHADGAAVET
jgi:two-component system OmpR family sensor kinase